jgi:hypothetical protein
MKFMRSRLAGIIVALAASVALSGCSAIRLGYNSLPDLAYWWLDGYVDFTETQTPMVRQELVRLHAWHRQQELPQLAEILGRLEQTAAGSISPQQACNVAGEVRGRLLQVAERAEPAVVSLAQTVAPHQLRHLQRKYRTNNETFRKDWLDLPAVEQKEKRFTGTLDRLESIYGRLDEQQRTVLRQGIEQSIHDPARILAERQRRQQDLLQTLRRLHEAGLAPEEARNLLRGYVERTQRSPDAAYRNWQEALLQESCRIFAAVHESTTPAQRENAVRRLRAYQRDLRELSGQR